MRMRQRPVRGAGMVPRVSLPQVSYAYRGNKSWLADAEKAAAERPPSRPHPAVKAARERMAARLAEFTRLREQDVAVLEAGARVGVSADRARVYERMRKQAAAAEGAGA